jgi:hypothetical protein
MQQESHGALTARAAACNKTQMQIKSLLNDFPRNFTQLQNTRYVAIIGRKSTTTV